MVDEKYLITALVAVPLMILLAITVTNGLFNNNRVTFENAVNETNSTSIGLFSVLNSTYDCKLDSVTSVSNITNTATLGASVFNGSYNVTYITWGKCNIQSGLGGTNYIVYTAYKDTNDLTQYTAYKNIVTQTTAGQKLSAMVP